MKREWALSVSSEHGEFVSEKTRLQLSEAPFILLKLLTLLCPQLSAEGPSLTTVAASLPSRATLLCALTAPSSQHSPGGLAPVLCSVSCGLHSLAGRPGSCLQKWPALLERTCQCLPRALGLSVLPGVHQQVGFPRPLCPREGVQENPNPWDLEAVY